MDDLFAVAAQDLAIPVHHWNPPPNASDSWNENCGPHASRGALFDAIRPTRTQRVLLDQVTLDRVEFTWAWDKVTKLWVYGFHAQMFDRMKGCLIGYAHGGFPSEDSCKEAARHTAMGTFRELQAASREADRRQPGRWKPSRKDLKAVLPEVASDEEDDESWDQPEGLTPTLPCPPSP